MENMPGMSDIDWKKYLQWVADYGYPQGKNSRKVKRQLDATRQDATVIAFRNL